MGFILASGVLVHLKETVPNLSGVQLHVLAERIAAGNAVAVPGLSPADIHDALANGMGVWIMAVISFFIFNTRSVQQAKVQRSD